MAKKVIFNNKIDGNEFNMLVGKVGEHVFALTKSVKEMNDAIRWCNNHKVGDVFECEKYRMELQKSKKGHNLVTYFAWYMFNKWSLDEAIHVFGFELGNHIYLKWEEIVYHGDGDQLRFYCNLDTVCRNRLVQRALDIYNKNEDE